MKHAHSHKHLMGTPPPVKEELLRDIVILFFKAQKEQAVQDVPQGVAHPNRRIVPRRWDRELVEACRPVLRSIAIDGGAKALKQIRQFPESKGLILGTGYTHDEVAKSVAVELKGDDGRWVTMRGRHVLIREGQTAEEALAAQDSTPKVEEPVKLSAKAEASLDAWITDYEAINEKVRSDGIRDEGMDEAISKSPGLPADIEMLLYRGLEVEQENFIKETSGYKKRMNFYDEGYQSFSTEKDVADKFALGGGGLDTKHILIVAHVEKGTRLAKVASGLHELVATRLTYKIISTSTKGDTTTIHAKVYAMQGPSAPVEEKSFVVGAGGSSSGTHVVFKAAKPSFMDLIPEWLQKVPEVLERVQEIAEAMKVSEAPEWIEDLDTVEAMEAEEFQFAQAIGESTADTLRTQLTIGMEHGEATAQLKKRVADVYEEWTGYRAERIARTESARAYTKGHIEAWRKTGVVDRKVWVAASDACPFCLDMDGTVIDLEDNFFDKGEEQEVEWNGQEITMMHDYSDIKGPPLHPNCRCAVVGELKGSKKAVKESEGQWVTMRGRHVFIREGQTAEEALSESLRKKDPADSERSIGPEDVWARDMDIQPGTERLVERAEDGMIERYAGVHSNDWENWAADPEPFQDALQGKTPKYFSGETLTEKDVAHFKEVAETIQKQAMTHALPVYTVYRGMSFETKELAEGAFKKGSWLVTDKLTSVGLDRDVADTYATAMKDEYPHPVVLRYSVGSGRIPGIQTAPMGSLSAEGIMPIGARFRVASTHYEDDTLVVDMYTAGKEFRKLPVVGGIPNTKDSPLFVKGLPVHHKGGEGSGFHGHAGIPGHQGGSAPAGEYPVGTGPGGTWRPEDRAKVTEEHIRRRAQEIAAMDEAVRDDMEFNGGVNRPAYNAYEAEKLMPKADGKFKKLTDSNVFSVNADADYVVNVGGKPYLVSENEDPDDEEELILTFTDPYDPRGQSFDSSTADKKWIPLVSEVQAQEAPPAVSEFDKTMREKTFTMPLRAERSKEAQLVWIDTKKFDEAFQLNEDSYIGVGGKGGINRRYPEFATYFNDHDSIEVSEVVISKGVFSPKGQAQFINGRHRYAYMRDQGATSIPVAFYSNSDSMSVEDAVKEGFVISSSTNKGDNE